MSAWRRSSETYLATLAVFAVVDALWLIFVAADLFKRQVAPVLRESPDLAAAVALYLVYAGGICWLAIRPAGVALAKAVLNGAILGFVAYAIFDLTNLAIVKGWTLGLALVDMAWGTFATALAASAGHAVAHRSAASPS